MANARNDKLESTLKRVRDRENVLSQFDEANELELLNNEIANEKHVIKETEEDETSLNEEMLDQYFSKG
jgi:hypothetical protein